MGSNSSKNHKKVVIISGAAAIVAFAGIGYHFTNDYC